MWQSSFNYVTVYWGEVANFRTVQKFVKEFILGADCVLHLINGPRSHYSPYGRWNVCGSHHLITVTVYWGEVANFRRVQKFVKEFILGADCVLCLINGPRSHYFPYRRWGYVAELWAVNI